VNAPVLVAGGTGRLGSALVADLAARGVPLRVLTRDPRRAHHLAQYAVEVIPGDVTSQADVTAAVRGTRLVVSAVHGFTGVERTSVQDVDRDGNARLIDAAHAAGAEFVLMSVVGASAGSGLELFRGKAEAEAHLASTGGGTVVRATAFLELWIEILERTAGSSGRPLVFGRGRNPINFVSVVDVAALLTRLVLDPSLRGRTIEIGGPRDLVLDDLALLVADRLRQPAATRHLPRGAMHALAGTVGRMRPAVGRQLRTAMAMDVDDLRFTGTRSGPVFDGLLSTDVVSVLQGPHRPAAVP
jgi:NADH dehydrogenase